MILDFFAAGAHGRGTPPPPSEVKEAESLTCLPRYCSQYADVKTFICIKDKHTYMLLNIYIKIHTHTHAQHKLHNQNTL